MIPFADYLPDQAPLWGRGAQVAKGVLPLTGGGYAPMPSLTSLSPETLDSRVCGATSLRDRAHQPVNYIGTKGRLYRQVGGTHTDRSKAVGYTVRPQDHWEFAAYADALYAATHKVRLQVANYQTNTQFADHPTDITAPTVAQVGLFLVLGDVETPAEGERPYRVQWSAFDDPQDFTPDPTGTQAGFQDLPADWGPILRVVGGEFGLVLRERAIHRMDYVGGATIWDFGRGPVLKHTGPVSATAVAEFSGVGSSLSGGSSTSDVVAYLGHEGFVAVFSGYQYRAIGEGKVDRTVLAEVNKSRYHEISTAVDPSQQVVFWAYPSVDSPSGCTDRIVAWNYAADRWAQPDECVEWLFESNTLGLLTDNMSSANGWPLMDTMTTFLLDADEYKPGGFVLGAYDPEHSAAFFSGTPGTAILESAEAQMTDNRRTMVTEIRPIVDGGSCSVELGYRQRQADPVQYTAPVAQRPNGRCPMRKSARFHRARVTIEGDFSEALGIDDIEGATTEWR